MATPAPARFWSDIGNDLRPVLRDVINQSVYMGCTVVLQAFGQILDACGVPPWLTGVIQNVFNGLTVIALINLAIPMGLRMLRATWVAIRK